MKKLFFILIAVRSLAAFSQASVGSVSNSFCAGNSFSLPYTISGSFSGGNTFTAQLSDASGSFASPVSIGNVSSTAAGSISCAIPGGTASGALYHIRIISSNPFTTGAANASNITIYTAAPAQPGVITANTPVCAGSTQSISISPVPNTSFYTWNLPSGWSGSSTTTTISATAGTSGGNVSVTANNTCGASAAQIFAVSVPIVDDGIACTADYCNSGVVTHTTQSFGVLCRAAAGICDVSENCDGISTSCPADVLACAATVCRATSGACDISENCTGASVSCPADLFSSSSTICRESTGLCDIAENCTGSTAPCPANAFSSASTVCRSSSGACDIAEVCSGSSDLCPADVVLASSAICRSALTSCDAVEFCNGTGKNCPADVYQSANTICRSSAGACDLAENCTGVSTTCPADIFSSASTVCRAKGGVCDLEERCNGASANCSADLKNAATICRSASGICDLAEQCDGITDNCPADILISSGISCRAAVSSCDPVENCNGSVKTCPADIFRDGANNSSLAGISSSGVTLVEECTESDWTYYCDPADHNKFLFAIYKNAAVNSFNPAPVITIKTTAPTAYDQVESSTSPKATFTMGRYWNVTQNGTITAPVKVRFFYSPSDISDMQSAAASWALTHPSLLSGYTTKVGPLEWFKTSGIPYNPQNNTYSTVPGMIKFAANTGTLNGIAYQEYDSVTSFSGGTAGIRVAEVPNGSPPVALPVKLVRFKAQAFENSYIQLSWTTASEINNRGFEIEHSTDGNNFEKIGWMDGNENSNSLINYRFDDRSAVAGTVNYYRLKQVDEDGESTYSNIASASLENELARTLGEFVPNPSLTFARLLISTPFDEEASAVVNDVLGRKILSLRQDLKRGFNELSFDFSSLPSGTYNAMVTIGGERFVRRIVVKK